MEASGRPTVHPALFIGGKTAGYFTWVVLVLALTGISGLQYPAERGLGLASSITLFAGITLIIISSFTLGRSIRIGLPTNETVLRTGGIYRYSRNPMYLGLHLITLTAMLVVPEWWVAAPGLFSYFAYHQIALGEEKFLGERFGQEYLIYTQNTRRYI
jgi:protein-S-isoprenylcysteine O-methyltransferase Ste14